MDAPGSGGDRLPVHTKIVYALGDHTVNLVLSAASLLYLMFLTDVVGLRPALAASVLWIARAVDAFSDPAMGRLSDLTTWRAGRRRPYFLIGAVPFGIFFALMWADLPGASEGYRFVYYAAIYVGVSLAMTCVSVPYLALIPEMATSYDERTSFNTYRSAAAVLGVFAAVAMKPLADYLGGDAAAWQRAGMIAGVWVVLPWFAVWAASFERTQFRRKTQVSFLEGARLLVRHQTYRKLAAFYIAARIAVDLMGAMFIFYFAGWLGREDDFAPTLFLFLSIVVLSLPFWLRFARGRDKSRIFMFGATWWVVMQAFLWSAEPDWPRWTMFLIAGLAAIGYAVADLMPWAMLGDVIDEDELRSGERREGVYVGFFTFLRKLGGATAILLVGIALDLAGYVGGAPAAEQTDTARTTIRVLTSIAPAAFLVLAVGIARGYTLGRARHDEILRALESRRGGT